MSNNLSILALAGALALAACGNQNAIKPPSSATGEGLPTTTSAKLGARTQLSLSDEIRSACDIDFSATDKAPKLGSDPSQLDEGDRDVLRQVARCITTGPLRGRSLSFIGRADPRGETEHNMALGGWRAASVRAYLSQLGIEPGKATKLDGAHEAALQMDRRVDILLSDRPAMAGNASPNGG